MREPAGAAAATAPASSAGRSEPVDGGADYFSRFGRSFPVDPGFFPIGVWFESVTDPVDVQTDSAAGLNTYVALTANSDLELIDRAGLHALPQAEEWVGRASAPGSAAVRGWLLADEVDMTQGPAKGLQTLRTVLTTLPSDDGRLLYNNYGKGVMFWETTAEAERLVDIPDIVSADTYWFTDRNICGISEGGALLAGGKRALRPEECQLAANYGRTVRRMRSLVSPAGSKPVWNFVEVGHPATEADWPTIRPAQVRAAVWSGIINGARGVVYFNHSYGGAAQTQHVLREPGYAAVRATVTAVNHQITELAPVLNSPTVLGLVDVDVDAAAAVDVLVKADAENLYVFTGSTRPGAAQATFTVPCAGDGPVSVLGEQRTVAVAGHAFTDRFADADAVHLYRIPRSASCSTG